MPGRHHHEPHPDPFAPAPTHGRLTLALGAVAIVGGGAMIGGWTILTGGGRDDPRAITVQPSAAPTAPPATLDGSAGGDLFVSTPPSDPSTASTSPAASGTPGASAPTTRFTPSAAALTISTSPVARVSVATTAPPSPMPAASSTFPDDLTASYALTSTSADGFVAGITVHNPTTEAQAWTVVLTYPSGKRITVTGTWNATPTATGRRLSFDGGPLAPGASYTFGFQAVNAKSGDVNPDACTINGIACAGF